MTPAQAMQLLPVIQAFAEGKTVQCRLLNTQETWQDNPDPIWQPDRVEYRIKPTIDLSTAKKGDRFRCRGGWTVTFYKKEELFAGSNQYQVHHPKSDKGFFTAMSQDGRYKIDGSDHDYDILEPLGPATIRPWKPEEVPVGAVVRFKGNGNRLLITDVCAGTVDLGDITVLREDLLQLYEWRFPQETEWKACGVVDE